jgi:hypothetical protein
LKYGREKREKKQRAFFTIQKTILLQQNLISLEKMSKRKNRSLNGKIATK